MGDQGVFPVFNGTHELDNKVLLTESEKRANNFRWYKHKADTLFKRKNNYVRYESGSFYYSNKNPDRTRFDRTLNMKVNYDLYNNILNMRELSRTKTGVSFLDNTANPMYQEDVENFDIVSNKIKVIQGLEMRRPLDLRFVAVNPDATTRREQKMTEMVKQFVNNQIMAPIQRELEMKRQQELAGRELSEEEIQQIDAKLQEELAAKTPDEAKEYMEREYQDPAEVQANQLLNFLRQKTKAADKFNEGCKQAALVAHEAYWVGENRGHPDFRVITDFTRATYDDSREIYLFEDGEFFTYEYLWTPSQMIAFFGDELDRAEINKILTSGYTVSDSAIGHITGDVIDEPQTKMVSVFHATWKDFRELSILSYIDEEEADEENKIKRKIVDNNYKINPLIGDLMIEKQFYPESYETYIINGCVYKRMRPIPGQFRDINELHNCKLSYYGAKYDNTNSTPTSFMDRGKSWLFYNNIVHHRLKKLMASDKGKKVALSYKSIPDTEDMTMEDFFYNAENSPYMMLDPTEEGNTYNDLNTAVRVVDLSLTADIKNYYDISERIKQECADAMGVSRQLEAQIQPRDGLGNTKQALVSNSYLLEPFFNMRSIIKRNVLEALIETAKVVYENRDDEVLSFVLDDMSVQLFKFDYNLLKNSNIGLYLMNDSKTFEIKDTLVQLAHAAMQNGTTDFSDIISVLKEDSIENAEAKLRRAEKESRERQQQAAKQEQEGLKELERMREDNSKKEHERQKELTILKEEERRKTILQQSAITGMSFNPDSDNDRDGVNDFFEIAKHGLEADIKSRQQDLAEKKFDHDSKMDEKKIQVEREKIAASKHKQNK